MEHSKFRKLAAKAQELRSSSPQAHGRRLEAFALLGLAYPYAFAGACLAGCVLCAWGAFAYENGILAALGGLFLGFLIRFVCALGFALRPPQGVELKREDAPELFEEIETLARKLGAKTPGHVLLDCSFNAGAASLPGRWLLSPGGDYLLLGLPLMAALKPEEFRSVLAHELGHFSLAHPAGSRHAWKALQTWLRLNAMVRSAGGILSKFMLGAFADWYLPRLDALLAAGSRSQEFDADAKAASVVGAEASARALAVHAIQSRKLALEGSAKFWDKARQIPEPPQGFLKQALATVRSARPSQEETAKLFACAKRMRALDDDSHPALGERLAKFGFDETPPGPSPAEDGPDAAQTLLGDAETRLAPKLEELWRKEAFPAWAELHARSQAARQALSEMLRIDFKKALSLETKLQRARLLELACGPDAAKNPLEEILEEDPDCLEAKFLLGRVLLALGKPEGAPALLAAMKENQAFVNPGFEILASFYRAQGMPDEYAELMKLKEAAPQESARPGKLGDAKPKPPSVKSSWQLAAMELSQKELAAILQSLAENGTVERAYLALAKDPEAPSQPPFHVLLVARRFSLLAFRGEDDSALALELAKALRNHRNLLVAPLDKAPALFKIKLKLLRAARIFKA